MTLFYQIHTWQPSLCLHKPKRRLLLCTLPRAMADEWLFLDLAPSHVFPVLTSIFLRIICSTEQDFAFWVSTVPLFRFHPVKDLCKLNFTYRKEPYWFQRSLLIAWDINQLHKSLQMRALCGLFSLILYINSEQKIYKELKLGINS